VGKVSGKKGFIYRDVFDGFDAFSLIQSNHPIDQQKGITVG
jgi:hypothetical protein